MKKVCAWGNSMAIRLTKELKELDIEINDNVNTYVKNGKIIIEKIENEIVDKKGSRFVIKRR